MKLSELSSGLSGVVVRIRGRGSFRKRIMEMGFVKGRTVTVVKNAPLRDPVEYRLMNFNVSLRRSEAALIEVHPIRDAAFLSPLEGGPMPAPRKGVRRRFRGGREAGPFPHGDHPRPAGRFSRRSGVPRIRIALVGNPNSGKTTIFNYASGSAERIGNYSGVTIQSKTANVSFRGYLFEITDLPGTYSITEYSPDELFVREHLIRSSPDVVVNIIDASNLERNLYLTVQLMEMNIPLLASLNMYDELEARGDQFDHRHLGIMLGIPMVPTVGPEGMGIPEILQTAIDMYEKKEATVRPVSISYGADIERSISAVRELVRECTLPDPVSDRYAAVKLLEKDDTTRIMIADFPAGGAIMERVKDEIRTLEYELRDDTEALIADARYGFIAGALRETYRPAARPPVSPSEAIDRILTHQVLGIPIFLLFLWATFQFTFTLGNYPKQWLEAGAGGLARLVASSMQPGLLRELLTDGIIAGVGGVLVFLPSILILFFMISLMEDSGYMARASFIMDRLMHAIGLHGKSFIPLIMGFGCNVPAIMATRTLESRNDRILTMLIIPFMSCSARLPVYVLITGAFFPAHAGSVLFLLYIGGVLVGVASSMLLKRVLFRSSEAPFVMELPPYRVPHLNNTLRHMWERALEYLKKIGGVVLIASILIWALGRFPTPERYSRDYEGELLKIDQERHPASVAGPGSRHGRDARAEELRASIREAREQERVEQSYISRIGKFIHPAMAPLGFDWKMSVSILTGLAAKEIIVSTLGILYHADPHAAAGGAMAGKLAAQRHGHGALAGRPVFSMPAVTAYLVFILLYFPCFATLAIMRRESGTWRWPLFSALFSTFLAWTIAFVAHRLMSLIW